MMSGHAELKEDRDEPAVVQKPFAGDHLLNTIDRIISRASQCRTTEPYFVPCSTRESRRPCRRRRDQRELESVWRQSEKDTVFGMREHRARGWWYRESHGRVT
jgi:hypothetical protein